MKQTCSVVYDSLIAQICIESERWSVQHIKTGELQNGKSLESKRKEGKEGKVMQLVSMVSLVSAWVYWFHLAAQLPEIQRNLWAAAICCSERLLALIHGRVRLSSQPSPTAQLTRLYTIVKIASLDILPSQPFAVLCSSSCKYHDAFISAPSPARCLKMLLAQAWHCIFPSEFQQRHKSALSEKHATRSTRRWGSGPRWKNMEEERKWKGKGREKCFAQVV